MAKPVDNWFQRRTTYPAQNLTPDIDDFFVRAESVHLEQMDRNSYWMGIYAQNGKRICLWIYGKGLQVRITENEMPIMDSDFGEIVTAVPRKPRRGEKAREKGGK